MISSGSASGSPTNRMMSARPSRIRWSIGASW